MKNGSNLVGRRSWGESNEPPQTPLKTGLHPKKIMLFVWWDIKFVLYYELLATGRAIDYIVY